jgi:hypothetical protein
MRIVRRAAALGLLLGGADACGSQGGACGFLPYSPPLPTSAFFVLSCGVTDLMSVVLSGPCATGDASPSNYVSGQSVEISTPTPGICHVDLLFASGFAYSSDVTFTSKIGTVSACSGPESETYVGPTQTTFIVNNPRATCVDAGADAPADAIGETPLDSEANEGT